MVNLLTPCPCLCPCPCPWHCFSLDPHREKGEGGESKPVNMKVLDHDGSDSEAILAPGSLLSAETQWLLFWPFVAWPLILFLFLSLCLVQEFWPCSMTSRKSLLLLPRDMYAPSPLEGMRVTVPSCLSPQACPASFLARHWALTVALTSPLSKINTLLSPLQVPSTSVPLCIRTWTCPFSPSDSCRSLFSWQGKFAEHSAKVPILHPLLVVLLNWVHAQLFSGLF